MTITQEITSLSEFEAWSGGKDTLDRLTSEQQEQLISYLEDAYPEGMSDTELNDFLWFEGELINEWLGIDKDGNKIGSEEWARHIIQEHLSDNEYLDFDSSRDMEEDYINTAFPEDEYYDEGQVTDDFETFCFNEWHDDMIRRILEYDESANQDGVTAWIDDNFIESDIEPWNDFKDRYDEWREDGESWHEYMNPEE